MSGCCRFLPAQMCAERYSCSFATAAEAWGLRAAASEATEQENEMIEHASDCAIHNAPAYEPGPCDCGATSLTEDPMPPDPVAAAERAVLCAAEAWYLDETDRWPLLAAVQRMRHARTERETK